jgi:hypothetical protein
MVICHKCIFIFMGLDGVPNGGLDGVPNGGLDGVPNGGLDGGV